MQYGDTELPTDLSLPFPSSHILSGHSHACLANPIRPAPPLLDPHQSYILHRLATITRLSGSKPHASTSSSSVHHPAGSDLKRDGKAKATSSRRTQQQQQREVSNDEIAGDRQGTLPSSPHHHATKVGLGISSSTSGQLPYPPSSSSTTSKPLERPTTSGPAAIEVEEFDADLASASSDEDGGGGGEGRGMAAAANKGKTAPAREQPQSPPPSIAATPTPTPTSTSSGPPQHHRAIAKKALPSSVLAAATSSSSSSSSKKKPSSSTGSGGSTKDTRKATATSDGGGAWQVNSLSYADVGIIPSDEEESDDEEEEDDEDEGDFDDLANDLEESLGLQHQGMVVEDEEVEEEGYGEGEQQAKDYRFPSAPSPPLPQPSPQLSTTTTTSSRPMVAGKKIPNQKPYKTYDSDIASSSESEDSD